MNERHHPAARYRFPTSDSGSSCATRGYRELIVWQKAMHLVPAIYRLVRRLPPEERYALGNQLRRAAVSVPSNIAEGQGRHSAAEFAHHLSIARGSLAELDTLLDLVVALDYEPAAAIETLQPALIDVRRLLQKLMQSVRRQVR